RPGRDRAPRQFELPARLQRDGAATGDVIEADDVAALDDRLPAEQELHAFEQGADAARALVRQAPMAGKRERRLLMLGPDPEFGWRLHARLQPGDKLVTRLNWRHIDLVTRH